MRAWFAIVTAVVLMAAAVISVAEVQHSTTERNISEARVADQLRVSLLYGEIALDRALETLDPNDLPEVDKAQRDVAAALRRAREVSKDHPQELALLDSHEAARTDLKAASADERKGILSGKREGVVIGDRLEPVRRFLAANARYRDQLDARRDHETSAASLFPIVVTAVLAALLLAAGGLTLRRDRRLRARLAAEETRRREREAQFQISQRRLGEALQVAADRPEADELLRRHLELTIPGAGVRVLEREHGCVATRLGRAYSRGADAEEEVLTCDVCGALPGETTCRPLVVGGEVTGSVLVESQAPLDPDDSRRLDDSIAATTPVLLSIRNLRLAETRAATDALTGLPNRRAIDEALGRMVAQAARGMRPLAVLMLDLDHFKGINDTYGHERGDEVLAGFGRLLRSELRASDVAGRAGGEEFVVLLPDTDRAGALALAEKLRAATHALRAGTGGNGAGAERSVTVSGGLAVFPEDALDAETIMRCADRALYAAKRNGRDRVECAAPPADAPAPASAD